MRISKPRNYELILDAAATDAGDGIPQICSGAAAKLAAGQTAGPAARNAAASAFARPPRGPQPRGRFGPAAALDPKRIGHCGDGNPQGIGARQGYALARKI